MGYISKVGLRSVTAFFGRGTKINKKLKLKPERLFMPLLSVVAQDLKAFLGYDMVVVAKHLNDVAGV